LEEKHSSYSLLVCVIVSDISLWGIVFKKAVLDVAPVWLGPNTTDERWGKNKQYVIKIRTLYVIQWERVSTS